MVDTSQTAQEVSITWADAEPIWRKFYQRHYPLWDERRLEKSIRRLERRFLTDPDHDYEYELQQIKEQVDKSDEEWFSEWLRNWLEEEFMSQSELARQIGAYPSLVSKWVNGVQRPRPEQCRLIAEALGLPLDYVLAHAGHRPADLGTQGEIRREIVALLDHIPEPLLVPLVPMLRGLMAPSVQESTMRRMQEWIAADTEDDPLNDLVTTRPTPSSPAAGKLRNPDGNAS